MSGVSLEVLSAGGATSVQDLGRPGYQRYGVTEGGVIDRYAFQEGCALLGQGTDCAALEFFGIGGRFQAKGGSLVVALTGAPFRTQIDGIPILWRSSVRLEEGQVLDIGPCVSGSYGYLSVQGGFDVPLVMGARATHLRAGFGGVEGRVLAAGDHIPVVGGAIPAHGLGLPEPDYFCRTKIRMIWGAQAHYYSDVERQRFLETDFRISGRRDRMGVRLEFDAAPFQSDMALSGVSDAVSLGDVQIPGDGNPAVLLADRQPSGGYPRIATVISADISAFAQLPTGATFRFEAVDDEDALSVLQTWRNDLKALQTKRYPLVCDPADIKDLLSYQLISGAIAETDHLPWEMT